MPTYNSLADFSSEGFNIGQDARVMTYLHGLSDFWAYMFDDASKVNLMLEANALTASDIYNKFLQLTSVISLEDISVLTNTQIKLLMISEDSAVENKLETYKLPADVAIKYAKHLVNRAFLPTAQLEEGVDFYLDPDLNEISFAKPLRELGFPFRTLTSGKKEFAVWAVDAKIDDRLVYDYYGKLININPTASSELFKNFVYGTYYLYVNGPNLSVMKRGLNVALGIPVARETETVLEVRRYLSTDQWLVITDRNSYLIPYGLQPSVEVGGLLETGDDLADWIEVKDYNNDGDWWINFMLPGHLMPHMPTSVPGGGEVTPDPIPDRYMIPGSYADWLMRNYLKTHTFLVNVKTVGFKNVQTFEQLSDIIREVKPSYTTPIYVWTMPTTEEVVHFVDTLNIRYRPLFCEVVTDGIYRFNRNSDNPISRGSCPLFIRMSVPAGVDEQVGYAPEINGTQYNYQGSTVTGFIAPQIGYRTLTDKEAAWDRTMRHRHNDQYIPHRGLLDLNRSRSNVGNGEVVFPYVKKWPGYRLVALHTTTVYDVRSKFHACGSVMPEEEYIFPLLQPDDIFDAINEHDIDGALDSGYADFIRLNFDFLFKRGADGSMTGLGYPTDTENFSYIPAVNQLTEMDFLVFSRIDNLICGAFWATKNFDVETPRYIPHPTDDVLTIQTTGQPTRGGALMGSPWYMLRDQSSAGYNNVIYSDNFNTAVPKDRSGTNTLITKRTFRS